MRMDGQKIMIRCQLCNSEFQFGPHFYNGKVISTYKLTLCMSCYDGNWDGFAPQYEAIFEKHLTDHGIPIPQKNIRGWYPRGQ
jgi:hypothetical protein